MDSGVAKTSLASHPSERWRETPIHHETYFISRHEERVERPGIKRPRATLLCKIPPQRIGSTPRRGAGAKRDSFESRPRWIQQG
jgi:hypothetical protein